MSPKGENRRSIGTKVDPPWWDFVRQVVMFVMGLVVIVYATVTPGHDIAFLVTGLVLIGIIPIDRLLTTHRASFPHRPEEEE